jgi:UDPglucose--hexose-1-phosphate uridylyltransferase
MLERDRQHVVSDDGMVAVWSPVAPTTPFALRAALHSAGPRFDETTDDEARAIAGALRDIVGRLHRLLGDLAYNLVFESAPRAHDGPFQWWVDVVPRLTVPAGFELGAGIWVNIVAPADAARTLREQG